MSGEMPVQRKAPVVERAKFPLVWKLFGLTALLIAIVVSVAVAITIQRANAIAKTTVDNSIAGAAKLFKEFERQRLGRLALPVELLGNDPKFVAYIQDSLIGGGSSTPAPVTATAAAPAPAAAPAAPPTLDLQSIIDQLEQRRQAFGSDLFILLDDQGHVIARTDQPAVTGSSGEDLYTEIPLVKTIVDDASLDATSGVMSLSGKLYHAAVAPVGAGQPRIRVAYLVNAYAIDEKFANQIQQSTNAGVMFGIANTKSIVRSANAPSFGMQQMSGVDIIFKTGKPMPPSTAEIERSKYVMTGEPLQSGTQTVGAAVFLRSLDRELAPFREIQNALLVGGGIALLLAFIFSWLIAKRVTHPIEELAGVAQAVTGGDYTVHPPIDRSDEVGILGRSFAKMITALRDKAEIEELYEQMAARSQEREGAGAPRQNEAAKLDEGTILVTDLRELPATVGEGDAANVIAAVSKAMKLQEAEVARQDGFVREIIGHRLVSVFRGDRGILHAIRAARAINEELGRMGPGHMTIGVGIATGEFVTGSVDLEGDNGIAIVGNAPLLAELFAWHAPTGYAYISYETAQAAGGEIISTSTREQVQLKWLPNPLPVASLPLVSLTTNMMRTIG